jgi:hypothetical protein
MTSSLSNEFEHRLIDLVSTTAQLPPTRDPQRIAIISRAIYQKLARQSKGKADLRQLLCHLNLVDDAVTNQPGGIDELLNMRRYARSGSVSRLLTTVLEELDSERAREVQATVLGIDARAKVSSMTTSLTAVV